ncbi:hypothetical protein Leryth_007736 [Lithospermum erythrorhizon]|nr:hypothetical protein Leryth_007736 [Lithospermum erythrorhizon]
MTSRSRYSEESSVVVFSIIHYGTGLWVIVHACPWYNKNTCYMEGETMRVMYEPWFVKYKVDMCIDIAYNVVNGLCTPVKDSSVADIHMIGDGGTLKETASKHDNA